MTSPVPPVPDPADRPPGEPLMTRAAAVAVAGAVLGLLVSSHIVQLTDAQTEAILTLVAVVAPLAAAWWARRHVWSPRQVARLAAQVHQLASAQVPAPGPHRLSGPRLYPSDAPPHP